MILSLTKMKYIIQSGIYGNEKFPIPFDKIKSLAHGYYGDFEKPYYHNALCILYEDEEGRFHYKTIGTFQKMRLCRKYLFFGKVIAGKLNGFKTKYQEKDIHYLVENFESEE